MSIAENIDQVKSFLLALQKNICDFLEHEDNKKKFAEDVWINPSNEAKSLTGDGITKILEAGQHIERAGVNFSHVQGNNLPPAASAHRSDLVGASFQAMGVSSVIHPQNPFAPTAHLNVRLFIAQPLNAEPVWWFGGGFDLTPYYGFEEDCIHWHKTAKKFCEPFGADIYPKFKKACDEYFYLKHRKEPRGIGGIIFDDLNQWDFDRCFEFIQNIGNGFIEAYHPILSRRKNHPYQEQERKFQCYRRARYVEFNLVFDRGTLFGLQSGGRTESILVSMPPKASWEYNWHPEPNTLEAKLYDVFLKPQNWAEKE